MIFYSLKINSLPKVDQSISIETENYRFTKKKNLSRQIIEICINTSGDYIQEWRGHEFYVHERSITAIMPNAEYDARAVDNERFGFISVAVEIENYSFEQFECETIEEWNEIKDRIEGSILIPFILQLEPRMFAQMSQNMRNIIKCSMEKTYAAELKCTGLWLELLSMIDYETRSVLGDELKFSPTGVYIRKADAYISRHYAEKIKISDVAAELKISTSYLSKIFKENTGYTFTEYLNFTRVNIAREILARDSKILAEEVVEKVGFCDVRYMNMMFKRFLGVNIRVCRQMDKELTLYYKKPWE